ncbi:MAG: hypothetical protein DSM106950_44285 [Stigonema ocellatum SAG 48.90 = DSM 106950]|nr:hypothetical protein [Stigonema ocellatum SAG 48.90 = DSM 106950]
MLSAIASLAPRSLLQPLILQPVAGDDDSVLFCRLWRSSELIKAPYDLGSDWRGISQFAIANCKTVPFR